MTIRFFHHDNEDDTIGRTAIKHVELNDEQLKQVSGDYIIANPQGESDWQKRQYHEHIHPGIAVPSISFN